MAYYPGCAVKSFTPRLVESVKMLLAGIGVEIFEIRDWVCCTGGVGDEGERGFTERVAVLNALLAASQGADVIATSCSLCLSTLHRGLLSASRETVESIAEKLGIQPPERLPRVVHLADIIVDHARSIRHAIDTSARVALYPGCGYLVAHGPAAARRRLQRLAELLGLQNYTIVTGCCGFPLYASRPREAEKLAKRLEEKMNNPKLVVTLCPLCKLALLRYTSLNVKMLEEVVEEVA